MFFIFLLFISIIIFLLIKWIILDFHKTIEDLYLIGADIRFISNQFINYFFIIAIKGIIFGGFFAVGFFISIMEFIPKKRIFLEQFQINFIFDFLFKNWINIFEIIITLKIFIILSIIITTYFIKKQIYVFFKKEN